MQAYWFAWLFLKHHFEKILTLRNPNQIPLASPKRSRLILSAWHELPQEWIPAMKAYIGSADLELDPSRLLSWSLLWRYWSCRLRPSWRGFWFHNKKPWDNNKLLATLQAALQLRFQKVRWKSFSLKRTAEGRSGPVAIQPSSEHLTPWRNWCRRSAKWPEPSRMCCWIVKTGQERSS